MPLVRAILVIVAFYMVAVFMAAAAMLLEYWLGPEVTHYSKNILWGYIVLPIAASLFGIMQLGGRLTLGKILTSVVIALLFAAAEFVTLFLFVSLRIRLGLPI